MQPCRLSVTGSSGDWNAGGAAGPGRAQRCPNRAVRWDHGQLARSFGQHGVRYSKHMAEIIEINELRVGTLGYFASVESIAALWTDADGSPDLCRLGATRSLLPLIDGLRGELRNPTKLSQSQVPLLRHFMSEWGRRLLPEGLLDAKLDVLVIVPHAFLHDLPFHLIEIEPGGPLLGTTLGITYASSRSLFNRCASRNPARSAGLGTARTLAIGSADVLTSHDGEFHSLCANLRALFPDSFELEDPVTHANVKMLLSGRRPAIASARSGRSTILALRRSLPRAPHAT